MSSQPRHAARTQKQPAFPAGRAPLPLGMAPAAERRSVRRLALAGALLCLTLSWLLFPALAIGDIQKRVIQRNFDDLEKAARKIAGVEGEECPGANRREGAEAAIACAERKMVAKRPFWVKFQQQGIDSIVAQAVVCDPNGNLWVLGYDDGVGRPQACKSVTLTIEDFGVSARCHAEKPAPN